MKMGTSIVAISLNYRLTEFDFLSGSEPGAAGIINNGLCDQRFHLT
jgi:carboxylesterase type B